VKTATIGIALTVCLSIFLFQGWPLVLIIAGLVTVWLVALSVLAMQNAEAVADYLYEFRTEI
jgi:hypothetical protein